MVLLCCHSRPVSMYEVNSGGNPEKYMENCQPLAKIPHQVRNESKENI